MCVWPGISAPNPQVVQGPTAHEKIIARYREVYFSTTKKYEVKSLMKALRLRTGREGPGWGN